MKNITPRTLVLALMLLLLPLASSPVAGAQPGIRREVLTLPKPGVPAKVVGSVKGDETVDHVVTAAAGQSVVIELKARNSSAYFNVLPPGTDEAIFIGSTSGDTFRGKFTAAGEYRIRVYLMRSAARRGETSNYTLTVTAGG